MVGELSNLVFLTNEQYSYIPLSLCVKMCKCNFHESPFFLANPCYDCKEVYSDMNFLPSIFFFFFKQHLTRKQSHRLIHVSVPLHLWAIPVFPLLQVSTDNIVLTYVLSNRDTLLHLEILAGYNVKI